MKKQLFAALLSVILILSALPLACAETEMSLYSLPTTLLTVSISFSDGKAVATAKCTVAANQSAFTYASVQKLIDGKWITVGTGMGNGKASGSVTLEAGASYRAYGYSKVYNAEGVEIDSIYAYSRSKTN